MDCFPNCCMDVFRKSSGGCFQKNPPLILSNISPGILNGNLAWIASKFFAEFPVEILLEVPPEISPSILSVNITWSFSETLPWIFGVYSRRIFFGFLQKFFHRFLQKIKNSAFLSVSFTEVFFKNSSKDSVGNSSMNLFINYVMYFLYIPQVILTGAS